jgi:hypothetical protein
MSARKTAAGFAAIAALAGSFYAASTTSAASVRAASTVKGIVNCRIDPFDVEKGVQIYTSGALVLIATGKPSSPEPFLTVKSSERQYSVTSRCHHAPKHAPLGPGGFPSTHASPVDCAAPTHIVLRFVVVLNDVGYPLSAKIEVTQARTPFKPLAYVEWNQDQSTTYMRPHSCAPR